MSGHNKGPGCAARSNFPDIAVVLLPWYPICGTYSEARWLYRSPARPIVPPGVCSALTLYYNMCSGCDVVKNVRSQVYSLFIAAKHVQWPTDLIALRCECFWFVCCCFRAVGTFSAISCNCRTCKQHPLSYPAPFSSTARNPPAGSKHLRCDPSNCGWIATCGLPGVLWFCCHDHVAAR